MENASKGSTRTTHKSGSQAGPSRGCPSVRPSVSYPPLRRHPLDAPLPPPLLALLIDAARNLLKIKRTEKLCGQRDDCSSSGLLLARALSQPTSATFIVRLFSVSPRLSLVFSLFFVFETIFGFSSSAPAMILDQHGKEHGTMAGKNSPERLCFPS